MRRSGVTSSRCPCKAATEILPESFLFERNPTLCAAEHCGFVQRDAIVRENYCRAHGTRASEARCRRHGEESAPQQSLYRLEPECRSQNDGWRLFAPRETRPAFRLDAGEIERARKGEDRRALFRTREGAETIEESRRFVCAGLEAETEIAAAVQK